ncbi:RNA polymerase sigma-70 factor (sigma-E family) [Kineococcus xinjiangensis]|uniref:RNA polymerase sigma-70 factor (Sigma-E family) n=1 Tax=Kineococcus xinjiangensis TaxID=512762 RepID=A0A2S6IVJ6_9ACTN|nr:SigE family RNA polymerase sigma factor [Kineococcus xinjiangensis]PPK98389.1 RNA polymerase sigma-70 factor (sigma-E family) [Kineococcus xinjiangensis]
MRDRGDFEAFVVAAGRRLHTSAYLLTRDHGLAEDLVQTALARAWIAWHRVDGAPEPYVRRILVHEFLTSRRRRWWGEHPDDDPPDEATPDTYRASDDRLDLAGALGRLPVRQRAVVVLRYVEGLPEAEVAELLGCSVGTVKSQASKALAKLRVDDVLGDRTGIGGER